MTDTFTAFGFAPWSPLMIAGDTLERDTRTVVHELLEREEPNVTLFPTLTRAGTLDLVAASPAAAQAGRALLSSRRPILLTSTGRPDLNMHFVVTGKITQRTDNRDDIDELRVLLTVPVQEILL